MHYRLGSLPNCRVEDLFDGCEFDGLNLGMLRRCNKLLYGSRDELHSYLFQLARDFIRSAG